MQNKNLPSNAYTLEDLVTDNAVKNLKRARVRAGLNGRQIADLLGVHAGTYRQFTSWAFGEFAQART